jgi:hypothetical protein
MNTCKLACIVICVAGFGKKEAARNSVGADRNEVTLA